MQDPNCPALDLAYTGEIWAADLAEGLRMSTGADT